MLDIAVASVCLKQTLNLTFFDSHYAATALNQDRKILSFDQAYDKVPGLTRIKPEAIIPRVSTHKKSHLEVFNARYSHTLLKSF